MAEAQETEPRSKNLSAEQEVLLMSIRHAMACLSSVYAPVKFRFLRSVLLILSIGSVDCGNTPAAVPDAGMPDDAASPTERPDFTYMPKVVGTFRIYDAMSQTPIQGATVSYGNVKMITDVAGEVRFELPAYKPFEVIATPTNHVPIHFFGIADILDLSMSRALFSEAQLNQLASALGATYDPTKAIIAVNAVNGNTMRLGDAMKVDTTVAYGFALVPDRSSPVGFKKSNTTLSTEVTQVYLVNVTPGAVPLMVTPPSGLSCDVYSSLRPQGAEAMVGYAHEISTLSLVCR